MNYVTWFLMLLPPAGTPGHPVYVDPTNPYPDAVSCQVRVIELRDLEPGKRYECRPVKGPINLSKQPKKETK